MIISLFWVFKYNIYSKQNGRQAYIACMFKVQHNQVWNSMPHDMLRLCPIYYHDYVKSVDLNLRQFHEF